MPKPARSAFLLAILIALLLVGGLVTGQGESLAQNPLTLALDADATGNTATSVGNINDCLSVELGSSFDVDIIIMNVQNLLGWEAFFVYDGSILEIIDVDVRLFQAANPKSNVADASEFVPDSDGRFFMGAADINKATDSGDGVLARLTLNAVGSGISPAELPQIDIDGDAVPDVGPTLSALKFGTIEHIGDTNGDRLFDGPTQHARIAVGLPCSIATPTPPPTPTPTPGAAQTPTPTPTPAVLDADEDRVPDAGDQCPNTQADAGADASGCSELQLEQLTQQVEEQLLESLTAGLNLDVSLDTVAVGGSAVVLAVFADQNDEPVPGVDITFKIEDQPGSDAELEGEAEVTKTSDGEGVAEATLEVGHTPGEIVISATGEGATETVTVSVVEAAQIPDDQGTPGGGESQANGTPEPDGTPVAGSTEEQDGNNPDQSGDGSGLPAWLIGTIAAAGVALVVGVLAAWRSARHRSG